MMTHPTRTTRMLNLFELSSRVSVERVRNTYITVCACCTGVMSVGSIWQLYTCVGYLCMCRTLGLEDSCVGSIDRFNR